jgi:hypothetical protein
MRALREQLLGLTQSSTVKPEQWEREPQTQEEWDDAGNAHPSKNHLIKQQRSEDQS